MNQGSNLKLQSVEQNGEIINSLLNLNNQQLKLICKTLRRRDKTEARYKKNFHIHDVLLLLKKKKKNSGQSHH